MFESQISSIKKTSKEYLDLRLSMIKLQSVEILSIYLSSVIYIIMTLIIALIMIVFVSIGGALAINEKIESDYGGFLILSGGYLVLLLVFIIMRKSIINTLLRNPIIRNLMKVIQTENID